MKEEGRKAKVTKLSLPRGQIQKCRRSRRGLESRSATAAEVGSVLGESRPGTVGTTAVIPAQALGARSPGSSPTSQPGPLYPICAITAISRVIA